MSEESNPWDQWENLDFLAEFERMTTTEDMNLVDVAATAKHPEGVTLLAPENEMAAIVRGERTYVVLNIPTEGAWNLGQACLHVKDHQCQHGAEVLNMMVKNLCGKITDALKEAGREVTLEGD